MLCILLSAVLLCTASFLDASGRGGEIDTSELESLSVSIQRLRKQESPDLSELAYIGIRGGALFGTIVVFIGDDPKLAEVKEKFILKASVFHKIGESLFLALGQSQELTDQQFVMFGKIYAESMKHHKLLNNSIFSPMVQDDLNAAVTVWPIFEDLVNKLALESKDSNGAR